VSNTSFPYSAIYTPRTTELINFLMQDKNHRYSREQALRVTQVFTRDTHEQDKNDIKSELQKPGTESSIRVVFATEALRLGVNIPDILRVIQYDIPISGHPSVLWQ
jgi:superfamily II DNA/RNA helicase